MSKQVEATVISAPEFGQNNKQQRNLFVRCDTFDADNKPVGTRIVDMYHFGTRNWLQSHHWWAMHNGHTVETRVCTADEIAEYVAAQSAVLAERYNSKQVAAA